MLHGESDRLIQSVPTPQEMPEKQAENLISAIACSFLYPRHLSD
jgi:hypothetical protein